MRSLTRRSTACLSLLMLVFSAIPGAALSSSSASAATTPHLTLSATPPLVFVGGIVTLNIEYVGVGLYQTTVTISPEPALRFDPPRAMPCYYYEQPNQCKTLTLRAMEPAQVTIRASAYGEVYDPTCSCWRFSGVSDDGPATVRIATPSVRRFLPVAGR